MDREVKQEPHDEYVYHELRPVDLDDVYAQIKIENEEADFFVDSILVAREYDFLEVTREYDLFDVFEVKEEIPVYYDGAELFDVIEVKEEIPVYYDDAGQDDEPRPTTPIHRQGEHALATCKCPGCGNGMNFAAQEPGWVKKDVFTNGLNLAQPVAPGEGAVPPRLRRRNRAMSSCGDNIENIDPEDSLLDTPTGRPFARYHNRFIVPFPKKLEFEEFASRSYEEMYFIPGVTDLDDPNEAVVSSDDPIEEPGPSAPYFYTTMLQWDEFGEERVPFFF